MVADERTFWIAWSQIHGVGPVLLMRIYQQFGSLATAWDASPADLEAVGGVGAQIAAAIKRQRSQLDPQQLRHQLEQTDPHFWTPADPLYPRLLLELPDPPAILYYRGQVEPGENQGTIPAIAVVGTRSPSEYGRRWTRKLCTALVQTGFTVVSGLAEGVDTDAHRSCLQAQGRTLAVLGTGVDVVYPWSNRELSRQIEEAGLLLSEYPAGTQPDRAHFPRRNRIVAGLCRATLVLEAPRKSGALITARLANDYGRDVYALPGSLDNARSLGCLELLNLGAQVILGVDELLEALGALPQLHLPTPDAGNQQLSLLPSDPSLAEPLASVLQAVPPDPTAVDWIVQQVGLAPGDVFSALMQLELMGLVSQVPGMRYQRLCADK